MDWVPQQCKAFAGLGPIRPTLGHDGLCKSANSASSVIIG